eukprot:COSAG02_NODE_6628_length_3450_cov_3.031334_1_plen_531_part_00
MTGIATKLRSAGYSTHQVSIAATAVGAAASIYTCSDFVLLPGRKVGCWYGHNRPYPSWPWVRNQRIWQLYSRKLWLNYPRVCCTAFRYDSAFGYFSHDNDYWNEHHTTNHKWSQLEDSLVDLYNESEHTTWASTDGAAYGYNSTYHACAAANQGKPCGNTGPDEIYEEFKFKMRALKIINEHNSSITDRPLFLCYTSHIVHEPMQVPTAAFEEFSTIATSLAGDYIAADATGDVVPHRQTYHAMVYYMDGVVGEMRNALERSGLWKTTLWFHQSDNGGPSFAGSSHTANNFPLKGSKTTNWQGGIRVNAFVSGGWLQTVAPGMIGRKLDGFVHVCDWYTTWCSLAGVHKEDDRALAANQHGADPPLPPVDGFDLWPYLSGKVGTSPRKEIFADNAVLLMEIEGTKWKLIGSTPPDDNAGASFDGFKPSELCLARLSGCCSNAKTKGQQACARCVHSKRALNAVDCTSEDRMAFCAGEEGGFADPSLYESRPDGSVLVGLACWSGPQYPNGQYAGALCRSLASMCSSFGSR